MASRLMGGKVACVLLAALPTAVAPKISWLQPVVGGAAGRPGGSSSGDVAAMAAGAVGATIVAGCSNATLKRKFSFLHGRDKRETAGQPFRKPPEWVPFLTTM